MMRTGNGLSEINQDVLYLPQPNLQRRQPTQALELDTISELRKEAFCRMRSLYAKVAAGLFAAVFHG